MSRRPAFDPSRLNDELDDLLPAPLAVPPAPRLVAPVPANDRANDVDMSTGASAAHAPEPAAAAPAATVPAAARAIAPTPAQPEDHDDEESDLPAARVSRRRGGRPTNAARAAARKDDEDATRPRRIADDLLTITTARIPKPLYDAVVQEVLAGHLERPSNAQLVAWMCEDHPADVIAEIEHTQRVDARAPRGRRLAHESVTITLRYRPEECRVVDELIDQVGGEGHRIPRSAGVVAALRVAVRHGITPTASAAASTVAASSR